MLRAVLDLLFPRRCLGCHEQDWPLCEGCWSRTAGLSPPWCRRCGRPFEVAVQRCADCPPASLSWSRAAFLYDGAIRQALMDLKFGGYRCVIEALGPPLAAALEGAPRFSGADRPVLTWVPLGPRRRRARGFDQAELLARALASQAGLPVRAMLRRSLDTGPQARRLGSDRRAALVGAFAVRQAAPTSVVLVDDVLTTGATAAGCARALRAAGARTVGLVTAARSLGGAVPARCYNPAGLRPGSVVARETFSR